MVSRFKHKSSNSENIPDPKINVVEQKLKVQKHTIIIIKIIYKQLNCKISRKLSPSIHLNYQILGGGETPPHIN